MDCFSVWMMSTNGAMCLMSGFSFIKSNYYDWKNKNQVSPANKNPVTAVQHIACMGSDHHCHTNHVNSLDEGTSLVNSQDAGKNSPTPDHLAIDMMPLGQISLADGSSSSCEV